MIALTPRPPCADPARERRLAVLERWMSPERLHKLETSLRHRVVDLTVVVDGIYDLGNAAAIMRTCDGLGVHRVHLVETCEQQAPPRRSSQGSHKWLDLRRFDTPAPCVAALRDEGYHIAGAALGQDSVPLQQLDPSRPLAVVFGNEHNGLSREMLETCDQLFHIDMFGLCQSFNVSVAAAISLHDLMRRKPRTNPLGPWRGDMPPDMIDGWREVFYRKAIQHSDLILARELPGEDIPPLIEPPT